MRAMSTTARLMKILRSKDSFDLYFTFFVYFSHLHIRALTNNIRALECYCPVDLCYNLIYSMSIFRLGGGGGGFLAGWVGAMGV